MTKQTILIQLLAHPLSVALINVQCAQYESNDPNKYGMIAVDAAFDFYGVVENEPTEASEETVLTKAKELLQLSVKDSL
jgi:hypothetical protein